MQLPPLLAQKNWRYFFRKLGEMREFDWMKPLPTEHVASCLATPVALARWLAVKHHDLAAAQELHIVIAGAELGPDSCDEGRWYQIVPVLLGNRSLRLTISLVGPNANRTTRKTRSGEYMEVPSSTPGLKSSWEPGGSYQISLGEFLDTQAGAHIDAVLLPHPGLEKHLYSWLAENELPRLLEKHIPVGSLAYDIKEYEHERWLLAQMGYSAEDFVLENPLCVPFEDPLIPSALAAVIWEVRQTLPPPGFKPNLEKLKEDEEIAKSLMNLIVEGYGNAVNAAGLPLTEGQKENWLYIPVDLAVEATSRAVAIVQDGTLQVVEDVSIPDEIWGEGPPLDKLPYDLTQWAHRIGNYLRGDSGGDIENPEPSLQNVLEKIFGNGEIPETFDAKLEKMMDQNDWEEVMDFIFDLEETHGEGYGLSRTDSTGKTALYRALVGENLDVAEWLLEQGADPDTEDYEHWPVLADLAKKGKLESVKLALTFGADTEATASGGWTPLMLAASQGHSDTVLCLVEYGASVHAKNWFGVSLADVLNPAVPLTPEALEAIQKAE